MKRIIKKKIISKGFYKSFRPQLTPKKMLQLGVFGGSYFKDKIKEYPKSWFKNAKLNKIFDVNQNRFKVAAGLSRKEWLDKGWIFKEDPLGWFQWYCRFKIGRRIPRIDEIQIKRWKAFGARHVPAIKKNYFRVRAGLTRKEWMEKGWIFKEDPLGWFQWYCRFKNGRRIPRIDEIQIKRWKAFRRHVTAIKKNCEPGDIHCRRRQRQAILQWAYNPFI